MIRLENRQLAFDQGDTVADVRDWLLANAQASPHRHVRVRMDGVIRTLRLFLGEGPRLQEKGLPCDGARIKSIESGNDAGRVVAVITVENDGSVRETRPVPVYYKLAGMHYGLDGFAEFTCCGKAFFDMHGRFWNAADDGHELDGPPEAYAYGDEIQSALFRLGCRRDKCGIWSTGHLGRLIHRMKDYGFELQDLNLRKG